MIPMILKMLLQQTILVAGTGVLVDNKLGETMLSDFRLVLSALWSDNPSKLSWYRPNTDLSTIGFPRYNKDEAVMAMAEVDELNLTSMNLKRPPVYAMQLMTGLKKLILNKNWGLKISQSDIEMISHLPIEEVSISDSDISIETLRALQGLPRLTRLNVSRNGLLSKCMDSNKLGDMATRLVELNVSKCDLGSEWLDDILECTNLTALDVSGNPTILKDQTKLKKLRNLKMLRRLGANRCSLTTAGLNEICRCGGLEELSVNFNKRLWKGEVDFGECRRSLVRLNAVFTKMNENGMRAICGRNHGETSVDEKAPMNNEGLGLSKLAILDISCNFKLGPVMSQEGFSFGCLENTLTELDISFTNSDSYRVIEAIGKCERLRKLNAHCNSSLFRDAGEIDFGYLRSGLKGLNIRSTGLRPDILSRILEFEQLVELDINNNDTACQDLGINEANLGGVKDTLIRFNVRNTGLTGEGLLWIFRELKGLEHVDVMKNVAIRPADLMRLDFDALRDRLIGFNVTTDYVTLADLQYKLPRTVVYCY